MYSGASHTAPRPSSGRTVVRSHGRAARPNIRFESHRRMRRTTVPRSAGPEAAQEGGRCVRPAECEPSTPKFTTQTTSSSSSFYCFVVFLLSQITSWIAACFLNQAIFIPLTRVSLGPLLLLRGPSHGSKRRITTQPASSTG